MDFAHLVRVLLRRWFVLLIGLVISGAAAYVAYANTPRVYEARSQIMLLMPPNASNPDLEVSPFLYLPAGLSSLAQVVALIPTTVEYRDYMAEEGFEPNYTLQVEERLDTREPIVTFVVTGSSPANTLRTRDELMTRFSADLDRVQQEEGVPVRQLAHTRVLYASESVTSSSGGGIRNAAIVAVVAIAVTLLTISLVERRSIRRSVSSVVRVSGGIDRSLRRQRQTTPPRRTDRARRGHPSGAIQAARQRTDPYETASRRQLA